jgi:hypothetical protein
MSIIRTNASGDVLQGTAEQCDELMTVNARRSAEIECAMIQGSEYSRGDFRSVGVCNNVTICLRIADVMEKHWTDLCPGFVTVP